MIAENEDWLDARMRIAPEPLEHAGRARTTVDQVAEKYEQHSVRILLLDFRVDSGEQDLEQIEPAVDVADNICPPALGTFRDFLG